jgi:hypothetical protein
VKNNRRAGREKVTVVDALRATGCSIAAASQLVGLSRSAYSAARLARPVPTAVPDPSEQALLARICALTAAHPCWGYRRVWAWLRYREGVHVNTKRGYRLMRDAA